MTGLEPHGFVQRLSKDDLLSPLGKGPGSDRESAHDVDHDRRGRGFGQLSDAKETSVHPAMIAHARLGAKPIARRAFGYHNPVNPRLRTKLAKTSAPNRGAASLRARRLAGPVTRRCERGYGW